MTLREELYRAFFKKIRKMRTTLGYYNENMMIEVVVPILFSRCWDDEYGWRGDFDEKKWGLLAMRVGYLIGQSFNVHRTAFAIAEVAKQFGIE